MTAALNILRERLVRAPHVLSRLLHKTGLGEDEYLHKRCTEGLKFCPRCRTWKKLADYRKDSKRIDGKTSVCKLCLSKGDGIKRTPWTKEEDAQLRRMIGAHGFRDVAARLGRTPHATVQRAYLLGLKWRAGAGGLVTNEDLRTYFKVPRTGPLQFWAKRGLPIRRVGKAYVTHRRSLGKFWRENPEAFDLYDVRDETLELYEIDLDDWPEPPCFKLQACTGWPAKKKTHDKLWRCTELFQRRPRCPECGRELGQWAAAYTDTWFDAPLSDELVTLHKHEDRVWVGVRPQEAAA